MICTRCLTVAHPKRKKERPSSTPTVLFLLSAFFGLFVWPLLALAAILFLVALAQAITHAVGGKVSLSCPRCQAIELVPIDSPGGRALVQQAQQIQDARR
jgi:hypothetical protein